MWMSPDVSILPLTSVSSEMYDDIVALAEACTKHDGFAPFDEQNLLDLSHNTPGTRLWIMVEYACGVGKVIGAAVAGRGGYGELAVRPRLRNRGFGKRLLTTLLPEVPQGVWAHGNLEYAQKLATNLELEPGRRLYVMEKSLDVDSGETPGVEGVAIRAFDEGDLEDLVRLNAQAFADLPDQGNLSVEDFRQRMAEPWFDSSLLFVAREKKVCDNDVMRKSEAGESVEGESAIDEGESGETATDVNATNDSAEMLAYLWMKPLENDTIEIYVLGVHPCAQGRGVGKTLMKYAQDAMVRRRYKIAKLYVDASNEAAVGLYRTASYKVVEEHVMYARR